MRRDILQFITAGIGITATRRLPGAESGGLTRYSAADTLPFSLPVTYLLLTCYLPVTYLLLTCYLPDRLATADLTDIVRHRPAEPGFTDNDFLNGVTFNMRLNALLTFPIVYGHFSKMNYKAEYQFTFYFLYDLNPGK